jgi:putative SOS response-associated peptidase YedK
MCGRYRRKSSKRAITDEFTFTGEFVALPVAPDEDIRPTTFQPIIRQNKDTGLRDLARWGFVPGWHKPDEKFRPPRSTHDLRA